MTNIINFSNNLESKTYRQALESILSKSNEKVLDQQVDNLVIIGMNKDNYSFAMSNSDNIRAMIGTMEVIKQYYIDMILND